MIRQVFLVANDTAIAATPIAHGGNLHDLLRQIVPPRETAHDLYRRLPAISELSGSMNAAGDADGALRFPEACFQKYLPDDRLRLCSVPPTNKRALSPTVRNLSKPAHRFDTAVALSGRSRADEPALLLQLTP